MGPSNWKAQPPQWKKQAAHLWSDSSGFTTFQKPEVTERGKWMAKDRESEYGLHHSFTSLTIKKTTWVFPTHTQNKMASKCCFEKLHKRRQVSRRIISKFSCQLCLSIKDLSLSQPDASLKQCCPLTQSKANIVVVLTLVITLTLESTRLHQKYTRMHGLWVSGEFPNKNKWSFSGVTCEPSDDSWEDTRQRPQARDLRQIYLAHRQLLLHLQC